MNKGSLKLYRGLSADEFNLASETLVRENRRIWSSIIERRAKGYFEYPHTLDKAITMLHKNLRLEYQHFTDSKSIARNYARKMNGLVIELAVPIKDLLSHFDIEFQNFGRRKKQFEVVYCVKGSVLKKYSRRWRLKVGRAK